MAGHRSLVVRLARSDDEEQMFVWRNDPFLVPRSTARRTVERGEHARWFQSASADPNCRLMIMEIGGEAAGAVRFNRIDGESSVISVYLIERFIGQGYGSEAIRRCSAAVADGWGVRVIAHVRSDNPLAARAFLKAGFAEAADDLTSPTDHRTFVFSS